jgi:hypothetical protein
MPSSLMSKAPGQSSRRSSRAICSSRPEQPDSPLPRSFPLLWLKICFAAPSRERLRCFRDWYPRTLRRRRAQLREPSRSTDRRCPSPKSKAWRRHWPPVAAHRLPLLEVRSPPVPSGPSGYPPVGPHVPISRTLALGCALPDPDPSRSSHAFGRRGAAYVRGMPRPLTYRVSVEPLYPLATTRQGYSRFPEEDEFPPDANGLVPALDGHAGRQR